MSAKRAFDDKLQGSVAAYLILKSVNIWQSYKQNRFLSDQLSQRLLGLDRSSPNLQGC